MNPVEFKDLPGLVGQEVGVSDWVEVSQERVNQFAEATGDHQWIHVDVERAQKEMGGTIAHGYLTLSLIPFLAAGLLPVKGVSQMPTTGTPLMSCRRPWMMLMPNTSGTKNSEAVVSCRCSSNSMMRGCEPSGSVMKTSFTPWLRIYGAASARLPSRRLALSGCSRSPWRSSK